MEEIKEIENQPGSEAERRLPVAPWWHTILLVAIILLISFTQAARPAAADAQVHRITTYAFSLALEALIAVWVLFGLRLRRRSWRELLGAFSFRPQAIVADLGIAAAFWIGSMFVLGSCALTWERFEAIAEHRPLATASGREMKFSPEQTKALEKLKALAPSNRQEIAAWIALCLVVGLSEELVFRGYLQRQLTSALGGRVVAGAALAAVLFGAAHAYQGLRSMVLLAVYGALFSALALNRRSLRACMMAHAWHDIFTGLALAALKAHHIL